METTKCGDDNDAWYNIVFLLGDDPRESTASWLGDLRPEIMRAHVVGIVLPWSEQTHTGHYKDIPIITWEEPNTTVLRAEQYLLLYSATKAEVVIDIGWPYRIPGSSEAGTVCVHPRLLTNFTGERASIYFHAKLFNEIPDAYKRPKKSQKKRL